MKFILKVTLLISQAFIGTSLFGSYQSAPSMQQLTGNFPATEMMPAAAQPTEASPLMGSAEQAHSLESNSCCCAGIKKCKEDREYRWRCCGCPTLTGIFALLALAVIYPKSVDMANTCYSIYPADCASCSFYQESPVLCPMPTTDGSLPYDQFIKKMREEFDPLCGTQAQYNVRTWACGQGLYVCSNDFAGYKKALADKCAPKPTQKFHTKFMKRSNAGRKK